MENEQKREEKGFLDGPPQTMFAFGLASGVAACAIVFFAIGGVSLSAGGSDNISSGDSGAVADSGADLQEAPALVENNVRAADETDHVRGDLDKAKVVLVEWSDFQCPYCARHHPVMKKLYDDYDGQVAWVYRHFPLGGHPEAVPAAIASECAAEQGKFWEYADELSANRDSLDVDYYLELAEELNLNLDDFEACQQNPDTVLAVKKDFDEGQASGIQGTPATFVNGKFISGALPYSEFKREIDAILAQ